ncbi:cytochrome P450 [Microbacterium sp. STN6]|uniref:cytochrome P450 n=1 Tax=Microbacterium sp. STN6 TaxID=2995588 RepID=UPI002260CBC8|nr:cytochrome P450 [Microbacterium sp. STN6]MCX7521457.1 cytochrome P450 [Microbacterium sp. STN6]
MSSMSSMSSMRHWDCVDDSHAPAPVVAPALPEFAGGLRLLHEGYGYGSKRFEQLQTDYFRARVLTTEAVFMRGLDAARFFYEGGHFARHGAMPASTTSLLQGSLSVQGLEGEAHRERKAMLVSLLDDDAWLLECFRRRWDQAARHWSMAQRIVLQQEIVPVLAEAAMDWAGVPVRSRDRGRPGELASMVQYSGTVGPVNWAARARRLRTEAWARSLIREARRSRDTRQTPLARLAHHRNRSGQLLSVDTAATELVNLLRPVVAVGRFIVYAALSLHRRARWRHAFEEGDEGDLMGFVDEVRRFYPFFPIIAGRAQNDLHWRGLALPKHSLVVLDLYATDHDPAVWPQPMRFRPQRFREAGDSLVVAQGLGEIETTHHCPGEGITRALMAESVRLLARDMRYEVPAQDLRVSLRRFPSGPKDGFIMSDIRLAA